MNWFLTSKPFGQNILAPNIKEKREIPIPSTLTVGFHIPDKVLGLFPYPTDNVE
jgi:hypothetical protein